MSSYVITMIIHVTMLITVKDEPHEKRHQNKLVLLVNVN